ncbi:aromatic hydrocarbon degradation ATPase [Geotalea daltonii FRC-32]|uniref:Aromatic hydrocarbon degradation ATPase n=1 Tax=Geotalea daltonii (strain DSM 22248 / JCM 15807 / FRC-32) TaxID=316067 RepID=B9M009_GEODF|nr:MoxR family ATPase [Geotalea daltonii]ACM20789.1 aromatic hydrocarbon degradation ATPase [Geotalea daltonii FRC-32]
MSASKHENLSVPQLDPYFYVSRDLADIFEKIHLLSRKKPVNVLISGRQGCGKSSLVRQYAAIYQRPLSTFQVGILSEPSQLFGEYALEAGETKYKQFLFPEAIQTPNSVIHLEEINRPEHPKALNMLFSLLSDSRDVWLEELGHLKVADGVVFFATLNEGEDFVGTELLDAALRDRFYFLLMDYLPNEVEKEVLIKKTGITAPQADDIMAALNFMRGNPEMRVDVSTRTALMIGDMMAVGASFRQALAVSLQTSQEALESALIGLHVRRGHTETVSNEYILFDHSWQRNKER